MSALADTSDPSTSPPLNPSCKKPKRPKPRLVINSDDDADWGDFTRPSLANTQTTATVNPTTTSDFDSDFTAADLVEDMKAVRIAQQRAIPKHSAWLSDDDDDTFGAPFGASSGTSSGFGKKASKREDAAYNRHAASVVTEVDIVGEMRKAAVEGLKRVAIIRERERIAEMEHMEMQEAEAKSSLSPPVFVASIDATLSGIDPDALDGAPSTVPTDIDLEFTEFASFESGGAALDKDLPEIPADTASALQDIGNAAEEPIEDLYDTKSLFTPQQKIAYVGLVYLILSRYANRPELGWERTIEFASSMNFSRRLLRRLYAHMDIDKSEQKMIEQLSTHGVLPSDMAHSLTANGSKIVVTAATSYIDYRTGATIVTGDADEHASPHLRPTSGVNRASSFDDARTSRLSAASSRSSIDGDSVRSVRSAAKVLVSAVGTDSTTSSRFGSSPPSSRGASHKPPDSPKPIELNIRWTLVTDLFLQLISENSYDSRARHLLRQVADYLELEWWDVVALEKRVAEHLQISGEVAEQLKYQERYNKSRSKEGRGQRWAAVGLATLGGGLIIGLSAGLLAPVIASGLAAGFTGIGVAGTGAFLGQAGGIALITSSGVIAGGTLGSQKMAKRTMGISTFNFHSLHNAQRPNLFLCISGMLTRDGDYSLPFSTIDPVVGDVYTLEWEPKMLRELNDVLKILAGELVGQAIQTALGHTMLHTLMAGLGWPLMLSKLGYLVDNPWSVGLDRARKAGLILADTLMNRGHGHRPISLVGFSLGARVIFFCLLELARMNAFGIVEDVYLYGTPVTANEKLWKTVKSVVGGRFVNCYHTNDWVLGYLYRAVAIESVAGLTAIESVPGVENLDVSDEFAGHMGYRQAMPRLMFTSGIPVTAHEFEEPDSEDDRPAGDSGYVELGSLKRQRRQSAALSAKVLTETATQQTEQAVSELRESGVEVREITGTMPKLVLEHVEYKHQIEKASWKGV